MMLRSMVMSYMMSAMHTKIMVTEMTTTAGLGSSSYAGIDRSSCPIARMTAACRIWRMGGSGIFIVLAIS
jgi:hypothetical protein